MAESFWFSTYIDNEFVGISDTEIEKELQRYREYVLSNISNILDEFVSNTNLISVTIESFYKRPDDNLLKQLALYIDQVIYCNEVSSQL